MYYVSYITEYPIYEPAEGGYYYAGTQIEECKAFSSWKKANRYYRKLKAWFEDRFCGEEDRLHSWECGGCDKYGDGPITYYRSKYIGEGERVQITKKMPIEEGWTPYC